MIAIRNAVLRNPAIRFRKPVSLTVETGEQIAVVGGNGCGKSVLAQMITGVHPLKSGRIVYDFSPSPVYENIRFIAFKDSYGPMDASYYHQQRWNSQDRDGSPFVRDVLGAAAGDSAGDELLHEQLFAVFGLHELMDKRTVLLSSGEMRKFQLAKALLTHPHMLIIDHPFIGLDASARSLLTGLLGDLTRRGMVQLILLPDGADEIPGFITHVVPVADGCCGEKIRRECFRENLPERPPFVGPLCPPEASGASFFGNRSAAGGGAHGPANVSVSEGKAFGGDAVIEMNDVCVRYGRCAILKSLNWTVRRGERWALLGSNGSGKSALLSLVCADNPQSYACDISLFGRRRGSGESIWEIKRRIGYVSPEMHRACCENIPAIEVVAGGLYDGAGGCVRPERAAVWYSVCAWWMSVFGISDLRERNFMQLSDGEQRLTLLARAFVKDPELLVLDEPMQGLDIANRSSVRSIIDAFCRRTHKTLIMVTHNEGDLPACITHRLVLRLPGGRPDSPTSG